MYDNYKNYSKKNNNNKEANCSSTRWNDSPQILSFVLHGDKDQIEPWLLNLFENLPTCEQSSGNNSVINSLVSNLLDRLSEIGLRKKKNLSNLDNFSNLFIIYDPSRNLSVSDDGGEKGEKSFLMPSEIFLPMRVTLDWVFLIKVDREQLFKVYYYNLSTLKMASDYVIEKFHHCCHIIGDFKLAHFSSFIERLIDNTVTISVVLQSWGRDGDGGFIDKITTEGQYMKRTIQDSTSCVLADLRGSVVFTVTICCCCYCCCYTSIYFVPFAILHEAVGCIFDD
ncbi:hypothetical protein T02_9150 [Trichinella nativa]|uniref:Uncharacterized protein n=1 Tax=Trichinella nativa TaxID=6335 RepID=A0A0V1LNB4_9BILA|nr:hypothetical protein T02_9150 [Trichinella nativa]